MNVEVCRGSHNGHREYHLRYPGMTKEAAEALAERINTDIALADVYKSMLGSQQRHSELCNQIYEAAVKKKLIYGLGACGNGGIPTFDAIVSKCVEAIEATK